MKQRLIAESEFNRAQLSGQCRTTTHGAGNLTHRARTVARWTAAAALLAVGVAGLRPGPRMAGLKSSRIAGILNGVRLASAIWLTLSRPR